jgi:pyruvate/2-oxoglutarate dehydrogenase complex dihydrolipoamide acyltransferase (E2) component
MATTFKTITFPKSRLATLDVGKYGRNKHYMFGLLEVDVTVARQAARQLRQAGKGVSFTAWLTKVIANSLDRHKEVHAIAVGKRTITVFDSVDIALPAERAVEQGRAPLPVLIKDANSRTVYDIHQEIEAALEQDVNDEGKYILGRHSLSKLAMQLYYLLPQWLRLLTWKVLFGDPVRAKRHTGTVMVTTVGSTGRTVGWILPTRSMHNLQISIGSITKKPNVVRGKVVARDMMHLTIGFNHDIVDGVPARQFMDDLVWHIEKGRLD